MKKYLLSIDEKNMIYLNAIKNNTKASIKKIINYIIANYKENNGFNNIENNLVINHHSDTFEKKKMKEIRIKISEDEFNLLKEIATQNRFSSVSKEVSFRLINSLNENKYFTNLELDEFIKTRTEINAVGKNIYQLLKILRAGNSVKINEDNLKNTIDTINAKIDILSDSLGKIIEINNQRI
ncbi:hypothetical protein ACIQIM_001362 [Campylobacter upsaliensis]